MLKKTISYTDFNGDPAEEDYFFHLSKAELVELEMSQEGGMSEWMQKIIVAQDNKSLIAEFKNIILSSYGQRSPDGRRFIKSQDLRNEFESTEAYSTLFMGLVTDTDSAVEFINGVIPQDMAQEVAKVAETTTSPAALTVPEVHDPEIIARFDLEQMDPTEFNRVMDGVTDGTTKIID